MSTQIHLTPGDVPQGQPIQNIILDAVVPSPNFILRRGSFGPQMFLVDWGKILDFRVYGGQFKGIDVTEITSLLGGTRDVETVLGADQLTNIRDAGTAIAFNIANHQLSESEINKIFTELPATTRTATINVSGNPGAATCDPSIATAKGYTVVN